MEASMMNKLQTYQVFPSIPEPLSFLETLSWNLWWCWHIDAIELFRRINPKLWRESGRNPILFSTLIPQERLKELAEDQAYLAHLRRIQQIYQNEVLTGPGTTGSLYPDQSVIAYFSMEFGIHESLPLFAGGLGVLAGDHLKAASDIGLPLVGMGLLYHQGYFRQFLDDTGWQQEAYPETDIFHLPLHRAQDPDGNNVTISVDGPDGEIKAIVWKIKVGRIPLYLLDTHIPENPPKIRRITDRLYAGDPQQRLAQEVLLGIGGMRALYQMGYQISVCHMNEGHSAFCGLERLCQTKAAYQIDLMTAAEVASRTMIFTTHTPVAAGHDEFAKELVKPYVEPLQECLDATADTIISWGQPAGAGADAPLSMFVLGLRMSQHHNGVSRLHGRVARRMWAHVWPGWPENEVPIGHITNGIHIPSWLSVENAHLFERYLGPDWYLQHRSPERIGRIDQIYDEELWQVRQMTRARLIRTCREVMVQQYARRNAPQTIMRDAEAILDQDFLTIGFARRFATYKRATLLLKDEDRFQKLITSKDRPVQFIFAGKAHPKDNEGKAIIKQLIDFARRPGVRHRVAFLEDYDINLARTLIQGVDVWLNTPRRPMEACGTSGMKAAVNGVLNVSVLDGWWCERFHPDLGWAVGNGEEYPDADYQDMVDSQALYNLLENDVIPTFYDRRNGEAPEKWIQMMKASMKMAFAHICAHGMVSEYNERYYRKAGEVYKVVTADNAAEARRLLQQTNRLKKNWDAVHIKTPVRVQEGFFRVGETFQVNVEVALGTLKPDEVDVELYYGKLKQLDALADSQTLLMTADQDLGNGVYRYRCSVLCDFSGRFGFTVRVTPAGDDNLKFTPGLITWA